MVWGTLWFMANGDLDAIDRALLRALSEDSRASAAALAQVVGLTRQAVADRMERLKADGVIRRYTLATDPDRLGLGVRAFIAISLLPACSEKQEGNVWPCCGKAVGAGVLPRDRGRLLPGRVIAPDIADVRQLVLDLRATGVVQGTRTMLALETLFEKSALGYPEPLPPTTPIGAFREARHAGPWVFSLDIPPGQAVY